MRKPAFALVLFAATFALASGCTPPSPRPCQRYDAVSLTRENGFSARYDWKGKGLVDLPGESLEVSITALRPMKGPVELVHVVGDTTADVWKLAVPDVGNQLTSVCAIAPGGAMPPCGAVLQNLPLAPGGYYHLRAGDNAVLEAGIAFQICD